MRNYTLKVQRTGPKRLSPEVNAGIAADYEADMDVRAIAAKYGINEGTAHRRLMRGGEPPSKLTPRQMQILEHVARGATNHEIAAALVITVGTVKRHLHDAYVALEVSSRVEALHACGLLATPSMSTR